MIRQTASSALVALIAFTAPALAGGSIALEDVLTDIAAGTPALVAEIDTALKTGGLAAADVVCDAEIRLGNQWVELGGTRVVPITCEIAGRTLTIDGTVTFRDAKGRALPPDDSKTAKKAVKVEQTNLTWSWK